MSYAVRAWRDSTGHHGITIGTVEPVGWNNYVAEICLIGDEEAAVFLRDCTQALQRAQAMTGPHEEPMPGPYDSWDHE